MLSIGIDVSKEKSTVCVMRPFGEVEGYLRQSCRE